MFFFLITENNLSQTENYTSVREKIENPTQSSILSRMMNGDNQGVNDHNVVFTKDIKGGKNLCVGSIDPTV